LRVRTQQAIGVLAGATAAGDKGIGLQMIAAQRDIDVQAQAGSLTVQARDQLQVVSANAGVSWAAARKITLATAAGASIVIDGGNLTVLCPGKMTIHAAQKLFDGPIRGNVILPQMPGEVCKECLLKAARQGAPGVLK